MGKRKETDIGRLELAQLMLNDARFNLQHRRFRCAISRSYYACHHAARACLDAIGRPLQKSRAGAHTACITIFSLHLIKTQIFPVPLGKVLRKLLRFREIADYELKLKHIEIVAEASYRQAESFVNEAMKYVNP